MRAKKNAVAFILAGLVLAMVFWIFQFKGSSQEVSGIESQVAVQPRPAPTTVLPIPAPTRDPRHDPNHPDDPMPAYGMVLSSLPKLGKLSEDHHHTPEALLLAGETIGSIEEDVAQNPSHLGQTIRFYEECLADSSLAVQVRALCYFHLEEHSPQNLTLQDSRIPTVIANVAKSLNE